MAPPIRNLSQIFPGQITASPKRILNRLAIRPIIVRGAIGRGGRRGRG